MNYLQKKRVNNKRRAHRVRAKAAMTGDRPRLSVHISNLQVTAQVIDDTKGITLAYASSVGRKEVNNLTQKATWVGNEIAAKAKKAKINKVLFDRGPYKYHGRVKSLADAARLAGLEF